MLKILRNCSLRLSNSLLINKVSSRPLSNWKEFQSVSAVRPLSLSVIRSYSTTRYPAFGSFGKLRKDTRINRVISTSSHLSQVQKIPKMDIIEDEIIKSPEDKRSYRGLLLKNGLRVLLISDPETDRAAASMNVLVGSMSDPREYPGLAHFLEHMLFLGTKKYPEENAYEKFLHENGGYSNAYTAGDHTNYHFEVAPGGLSGALDRFAQFFIEPLFTETATERELNAVHSEHVKNLQVDSWRLYQLDKSLSSEAHDYNKFGTGNRETLWTWHKERGEERKVREALLAFHRRWYSSNLMSLALLGKESLAQLTDLVLPLFSNIANHNTVEQNWSEHPYQDQHLQLEVKAVPIKELRQLSITWPIPDMRKHYKSKPGSYLGHLLGHEGKGSLLSELKRRGWANSLSAGEQEGARGFSFFEVGVDLSEEGLAHTNDLVTLVFQYLRMLREQGVQQQVFEELKDLGRIKFRFKDKENPISLVTSVSTLLHDYPLKEALVSGFLYEQYDPQLIGSLLAHLVPDKCRCSVVSKTFNGKTNSKERWYQTDYTSARIEPQVVKSWTDCGPHEKLHLPPANEFIPNNLELLERESDNSLPPRMLSNSVQNRLWYKQDHQYLLPKASFNVELMSPLAYATPQNANNLSLGLSLILDHLNEYTYNAHLAGLKFSLENTDYGIVVHVGGYNDKLPVLLNKLLSAIMNFKIDPQRFELLRELQLRHLKNMAANQPYSHASYFTIEALCELSWTFEDTLRVFDELSISSLEEFLQKFKGHLFAEHFYYGNLTKQVSAEVLRQVEQLLSESGVKPLLPQQMRLMRAVQVPADGRGYVYRKKNTFHKSNSVQLTLQIAPDDLPVSTPLRLVAHILSEPFFHILRTEEQLGYIVSCSSSRLKGVLTLRFMVQSERSIEHLERRIECFISRMHARLRAMDEAQIEQHKRAVIEELLIKPKQLGKQANKYWGEITCEEYFFDRNEIEAKQTESLNKAQVLAFFENYIALGAPSRRKFLMEIEGTGLADETTPGASSQEQGVATAGASASGEGEEAAAGESESESEPEGEGESGAEASAPHTNAGQAAEERVDEALVDATIAKRVKITDLQQWKRSLALWPLPSPRLEIPSRGCI